MLTDRSYARLFLVPPLPRRPMLCSFGDTLTITSAAPPKDDEWCLGVPIIFSLLTILATHALFAVTNRKEIQYRMNRGYYRITQYARQV
ncbi:hypothetical protein BDZ94DRAFT_207744 [Collybia nuda]|uniref:Uncharacterized protein n=1 Tax=Collybia nuda TaxID=64659 RepID=A0A9P6CHJ5_9AGAR|nr:hypothetical protein BDZ94DRAFT_207744 [Collybia nuda]